MTVGVSRRTCPLNPQKTGYLCWEPIPFHPLIKELAEFILERAERRLFVIVGRPPSQPIAQAETR